MTIISTYERYIRNRNLRSRCFNAGLLFVSVAPAEVLPCLTLLLLLLLLHVKLAGCNLEQTRFVDCGSPTLLWVNCAFLLRIAASSIGDRNTDSVLHFASRVAVTKWHFEAFGARSLAASWMCGCGSLILVESGTHSWTIIAVDRCA